MFAQECMHLRNVNASLSGDMPVNEETLSSVSVLAQRLERLKSDNPIFSGISFSEHMQKLVDYETVSVLG